MYFWKLVPYEVVFFGASCFPGRCAVKLGKEGKAVPSLHTLWWKQDCALTRHTGPCHLVPRNVALLPQVFTGSVPLHGLPVPREDVSTEDLALLKTIYLQVGDTKPCNKVPLLKAIQHVQVLQLTSKGRCADSIHE